jgi:predicted  nucleic acid-binding Zn-ribbon protein
VEHPAVNHATLEGELHELTNSVAPGQGRALEPLVARMMKMHGAYQDVLRGLLQKNECVDQLEVTVAQMQKEQLTLEKTILDTRGQFDAIKNGFCKLPTSSKVEPDRHAELLDKDFTTELDRLRKLLDELALESLSDKFDNIRREIASQLEARLIVFDLQFESKLPPPQEGAQVGNQQILQNLDALRHDLQQSLDSLRHKSEEQLRKHDAAERRINGLENRVVELGDQIATHLNMAKSYGATPPRLATPSSYYLS